MRPRRPVRRLRSRAVEIGLPTDPNDAGEARERPAPARCAAPRSRDDQPVASPTRGPRSAARRRRRIAAITISSAASAMPTAAAIGGPSSSAAETPPRAPAGRPSRTTPRVLGDGAERLAGGPVDAQRSARSPRRLAKIAVGRSGSCSSARPRSIPSLRRRGTCRLLISRSGPDRHAWPRPSPRGSAALIRARLQKAISVTPGPPDHRDPASGGPADSRCRGSRSGRRSSSSPRHRGRVVKRPRRSGRRRRSGCRASRAVRPSSTRWRSEKTAITPVALRRARTPDPARAPASVRGCPCTAQ